MSPPGDDFSEPVTQGAQRLADVLWALDPELAHRRHFPAVNWKRSYSLYRDTLDGWFAENVVPDWPALRDELLRLLQREEELQEIVQLVGIDALQDEERLLLTADLMRQTGKDRGLMEKTLAAAYSIEPTEVRGRFHPFLERFAFESIDMAREALVEGYDLRQHAFDEDDADWE